jgi:putative inorganic carbon (hco3(-)) transporter
MRDVLLVTLVAASIPFILRWPFYGLLMWVWLGIMNPHRLTFGFAYTLPFAQAIAIITMVSMLLNNKQLFRFPSERASIALIFFVLWLGVSPIFSFHPEAEFDLWLRAFKIQLMVLLAMLMVGDKGQINKLTWVLAASVGFFALKGGIFTIATGGQNRVWGPSGSFIADNNTLALAIVMVVPLFHYLQMQATNRWVRWGCISLIVLCVVSTIGSQSRGAFLALGAMAVVLWAKSSRKGLVTILVLLAIPVVIGLAPETWTERMSTIQTYEQDGSAQGRINAWRMAWNLAVSRFPIGGGFAMWEPDVYMRYAPDPSTVLVAHSIYFQILGEHGFLGLILFLGVFGLAWLDGSWIVRKTRGHGNLCWAHDLAAMCQVCLLGYGIGGAFLSLTYFDLPYYVVMILIVLRQHVRESLSKGTVEVAAQ